MQIPLPHISAALYGELKYWGSVIGALTVFFKFGNSLNKGINWVKEIRTNDLIHIQEGIKDMHVGFTNMQQELVSQTKSLNDNVLNTATIANELKEMRQDFRTFYQPKTPKKSKSIFN